MLPVPAGRIREQLLALGSESNKCTILHSITMTSLDGVALLSTGLVEGRDIRDIITPDILSTNLINFIFYSQFPQSNKRITFVDTVLAERIRTCNGDYLSITEDELCGPLFRHVFHSFFDRPQAIFAFCTGGHYMGVHVDFINADGSVQVHSIAYVDSLKWTGETFLTTVAQFLDWLAFQNSSVINWSQCRHISQLSDSMTTQNHTDNNKGRS